MEVPGRMELKYVGWVLTQQMCIEQSWVEPQQMCIEQSWVETQPTQISLNS